MKIKHLPILKCMSLYMIMVIPAGLFAVEYQVDRNNLAASDENPGTAEKSFRHVQRAADKVQPGDTITIHGGTYRESINLKTPGTKDKLITVQSAPGEIAVIKGSVLVRSWENPQPKKIIKNIEMNVLKGVPGLFSNTLGEN